jgi:hypothetical protein
MNGFLARAGAAAAAGVVLGTVMVTAASASGGGGATARYGALGPAGIAAGRGGALRLARHDHAIGRVAARPVSNRTFAGYQTAVRAGSATTSAASFTVPALSCTSAERGILPDAGIAVGRRSASVAFVFTGCINGKAAYFPGLVVNGTEKDFTKSPFAAGDVLDLTAKVSTNRTRVQVTDVTTGVTQKIIGAGGRAVAAWAGDDAAGSSTVLFHVPDFGKLTFKNCLIDGKALASWHPRAFQRVNSRGTVQISTGGFFPGGTAFTTHFKHS